MLMSTLFIPDSDDIRFINTVNEHQNQRACRIDFNLYMQRYHDPRPIVIKNCFLTCSELEEAAHVATAFIPDIFQDHAADRTSGILTAMLAFMNY